MASPANGDISNLQEENLICPLVYTLRHIARIFLQIFLSYIFFAKQILAIFTCIKFGAFYIFRIKFLFFKEFSSTFVLRTYYLTSTYNSHGYKMRIIEIRVSFYTFYSILFSIYHAIIELNNFPSFIQF